MTPSSTLQRLATLLASIEIKPCGNIHPSLSMFFHGIPSKYGRNRRKKKAGHFWKSKCSLEQANQAKQWAFSIWFFHCPAICRGQIPLDSMPSINTKRIPPMLYKHKEAYSGWKSLTDCQCSFEVHAFCRMEVVFTVPPVPQICRLSRTSLASPTSKIWWLLVVCELRFHEVSFCTLTIDEWSIVSSTFPNKEPINSSTLFKLL